jgi:hypothetical protein
LYLIAAPAGEHTEETSSHAAVASSDATLSCHATRCANMPHGKGLTDVDIRTSDGVF